MNIEEYSIDELASFRREYICSMCLGVIHLNQKHAIVKNTYSRGPNDHLHFHHGCAVTLKVLLTAHIDIEKLYGNYLKVLK